jgi:hypothetical protein
MKKLLISALFMTTSVLASSVNELTLHFIPSPKGMDWTTPSTLAKSALMNRISFKPRFIGHVFVELQCGEHHDITGMTGKRFDYLNQLLIEQKGLGILYHSFEGTLEEKDKVLPELKEFNEQGYSNFARFKLSEKQCQRVVKYLEEYRSNNVGRYYGLVNRPRFGEGAGCTAFGASFLDVLDIVDQDIRESWSHTVNVPLELAGPPLRTEGVSLFKIMFNAGSWAKENEKHEKLTFWDPDRMHTWVKNKVTNKQGDYEITQIGKSQGVVFDKSHIPTPEGPIWLQQVEVKDGKQTVKN